MGQNVGDTPTPPPWRASLKCQLGMPDEEKVGSKLLELFEKQVKKRGKKIIDVVSASNVDKFYMKNGYNPYKLWVKELSPKLSDDYEERGYDIEDKRKEGKYVYFTIKVSGYDPAERERVKKAFPEAKDVLYIHRKKV